ncbi:unnamed protein product [Ixodes persulcatus]
MCSRWKKPRTLRNDLDDIACKISVATTSNIASGTADASSSDASDGSTSSDDGPCRNTYGNSHTSIASTIESDDAEACDPAHVRCNTPCSSSEITGAAPPERGPLTATEELAVLARRFNFSHEAVNATAAALRRLGHDVPRDARTILGTQRKAPLEQDDTFVHFGLIKGLEQALEGKVVPQELLIQVNIDGLPLYKSSNVGFWPVLCRLTNCGESTPFVVSLFCGRGKPPDLSSFVAPFLQEMEALIANGLFYKGSYVSVRLTAVICDAPARSFVKKVKGHTGYHGCERCNQRGLHLEGRMTFPELDAPKRTDRTFRDREDVLHHLGHSPFEDIELDMITLFPLDYMHLVCLGVMRRLLQAWLRGRGCLSTAQKQKLTERLELCGKSFPPYFQRKPRGVDVVERWKATEFRSFLLYVGPIVLKGLLPDAE